MGCSPTRQAARSRCGYLRAHRRSGRVHPDRHGHPPHAGHRAAGAGGRSRHDHLRPHRGAARTQRGPRHRNGFRLDHRAACTRDRQTRRRGRPAADEPVRHPGPGRDQPPRLPRRTVDRLPQPRAGGRTRPQTLRAAGRHRQKARPHRRPGRPGTLAGAGKIGIAVGKAIGTYKVGKHFHITITDTGFAYRSRQAAIDAEAALDGIYVLRTSVDADTLDPAAVVESYKNLANVERDFRIIKTDDLDLRPIHHRLDERVRAHVLICLLACYLIWHLRKAWAPMTYTDEHPPQRDNPVAAAGAHPKPTPRHRASTTPTTTRYAASAACSTTWPPSPATRSATTAPAQTCPCSPTPPPTNAAPSNSSTPRYRSPPPRSQNNQPANQRIPRSTQIFTTVVTSG